MNKSQSMGMYVILAIVVLVFISTIFMTGPSTSTSEISYSNFLQKLQNKEFTKIEKYDDMIIAVPKEQPAAKTEKKATQKNTVSPFLTQETKNVQAPLFQYKVQIPVNDTELMDKLNNSDADITVKKTAETNQLAGNIGTFVIILFAIISLGLMIKAIQAGGSQAMSFGKSKAKMLLDSKVKTTFKDVAGIDEEKKELEEIVDFLKNGEKYMKLGAKIPKGVLLVGPPGTGKTLMAKAVAGEASVPFFSISGSDFVEMFVGVGASRVRDLFEQAKKHQPCIIFIDEIDAVGRQRGAGLGGGHDEREQTLNQLLVEMDGFDVNTNIIVIAATNRPDILDNALLRPGRFDRQIYINAPDVKGREQILEVHAKNKKLDKDVDLKVLAKRTPGFTGADLQNLLNESALLAARKGEDKISMDDVDSSIDRVIAGVEKRSKVLTDKDKELTSYHEVGHALIDKLLPDANELHKVSIIPRGMALGVTWTRPKDESVHVSKAKLLAKITVSLGGRAAEEIIYGQDDVSTGASQDLINVTDIARKMVTAWGMSEKLGPMAYGKNQENVFMGRDFGHQRDYSEQVAFEIDEEIKKIVDERYELAKQLLTQNRDMLEVISKELLEKETIDEKEFDEIMNRVRSERA
ncbi:MAG: ATP-dependent zinc metalloprotease FtsH [Candidatus Gastranaerophilaceae bacterium]|jgi:cell division protease FtsH|nr:ATP-dependent metallopeptidase FtsH/Yme1/Tma family protein [bacterium]MEE0494918.1 ATP-dependent zinc metalloprotease FtsH [Cyanobacteriota bacterium]CDE91543.1 aTP-dependent metallopeptidase HflB [Fusobacterium sp. CAG:815]DAA93109.1 MAG TPA: cell division protein FtsH [Candidatus Gastranaerophilales bacterium HUM_7]DAA93386.1 MAG TPA: cell division protein FtsH [Candidatus Gastranaerophilales bacterium HUM_6]DAB03974.1 MAG TPA: cell division protein FtsH [Candidatus Gastranaerophilales b